jgi:hypothetical protein
MQDLSDLSLKLNVEILRLGSSGTTDLNTTTRIKTLTSIKQRIDGMITDINNGVRTLETVPFMTSDINSFLPAMRNMNSAIPQLINDTGANTALNSLFPNYTAGDISGVKIARDIFDKYGNDIFKNLSWDITMKHKGAEEREVAKNYADALANAKTISDKHAETASNSYGPAAVGGQPVYGGMLDSLVKSLGGSGTASGGAADTGTGATPGAPGSNPGGAPARFDWKGRVGQICAQITARGMNPGDFGCMANPESMRQESFSWRGHTRMVCNRLNTVYDTSIPFLCGCPPPTWPGWKQ